MHHPGVHLHAARRGVGAINVEPGDRASVSVERGDSTDVGDDEQPAAGVGDVRDGVGILERIIGRHRQDRIDI